MSDGKGGTLPFVVGKGKWRDMTEGSFIPTGKSYDLAIQGKAFFQVQTPEGVRYTRDGSFTLGPEGTIVNAQGFPLLDDGGSPLTLPLNVIKTTINQDGTVVADGNIMGKVGLYEFEEKTLPKLSLTNFGLFASPTEGVVSTNVDSIKEVVRMIDLSRNFEILQNTMEKDHEQGLTAIRKIASK